MTDKEMGIKAGEIAHRLVIEAAEKRGLTLDNLMGKLAALTEAETVKVFNDKIDGIVYSEPLADNTTRLNAVKFAMDLRQDTPKQQLELSGGLNNTQEIDPLDREILQFYMTQKREELEREHRAELQRQYEAGELETP